MGSGRRRALLGEPHGGNHARGAAGPHGVHVREPRRELALEIGAIVKPAAREEAALHPAHELLDGAFLLRGPRPAQVRREAIVERHLSEDRVPDDQVALPCLHHGLRVIPDGDERDPAERLEAAEEGAYERFFLLVGHEAHIDGATPLQATREKVHALRAAVDVPDVALPEVVLTEFARHPLEAHDGHRRRRPQPTDQLVERTLAPAIAVLVGAAEQLHARQRAVLRQPRGEAIGPRRRSRRPTDAHGADRPRDRRLLADPLDAADGHGGSLSHRPFGDSCGAEDLNLMPGHGVDHSSPFSGRRASAAGPEKSVGSEPWVTRQNFRKGSRQNFRNPQAGRVEHAGRSSGTALAGDACRWRSGRSA